MTISVIMANYNGAKFLPDAIESIQRQTCKDWELIICDDASSDDSANIAEQAAAQDSRIQLQRNPDNKGAAAARNLGLAAARGDWIAIVDSDDLLHPERFEKLLNFATGNRTLIADDLVYFSKTPAAAGRTHLEALRLTSPKAFGFADILSSDMPSSVFPSLGYTKLFFASALRGDLKYDESLVVSEDFDFLLRLVMRAETLWVLPDPMYLYRRHAASLSFRSSVKIAKATSAAHDAMQTWMPKGDAIEHAYAARRATLTHLLAFEELVADIKGRRLLSAIARLLKRPALFRELSRSLRERKARAHVSVSTPQAAPAIAQKPSVEIDGVWTNPPCHIAAAISVGAQGPNLSPWFKQLAAELDHTSL